MQDICPDGLADQIPGHLGGIPLPPPWRGPKEGRFWWCALQAPSSTWAVAPQPAHLPRWYWPNIKPLRKYFILLALCVYAQKMIQKKFIFQGHGKG